MLSGLLATSILRSYVTIVLIGDCRAACQIRLIRYRLVKLGLGLWFWLNAYPVLMSVAYLSKTQYTVAITTAFFLMSKLLFMMMAQTARNQKSIYIFYYKPVIYFLQNMLHRQGLCDLLTVDCINTLFVQNIKSMFLLAVFPLNLVL